MKRSLSRFLHAAAGLAILVLISATLLALTAQRASAQARTIKLINPFPPGGTADIIARVVTEQIARTRGVNFVIENRPGAGTVIATEAVARAAPDGSTLLINSSAFLIGAHLRKVNYDPLTNFDAICNLTQSPQLLVVSSGSAYRSVDDFVAAARAKPGELTLSSTGPATGPHIAFEKFRRAANLSITYVPFPGNAATVNAILGGHVTAGLANYADWIGHIQAGKVRALATMTPARIGLLPDVPTIGEAGYKEFEYVTWFGIIAPAKLSEQIGKQLLEWFAAARQAPEVKAKLLVQGFLPSTECGPEFAAVLRKEYDEYGRVIHEASIKAE
jgi:tripartite-type tricarboxylate transporter receptor subunit TctC